MTTTKKYSLLFVLLSWTFCLSIQAQSDINLDSLQSIVDQSNNESDRLEATINLLENVPEFDLPKFEKEIFQIRNLAERAKDNLKMKAYLKIGIYYKQLSKWDSLETWSKKSLAIAEKLGDNQHIVDSYNTLGNAEQMKGSSEKAIEYYNEAIVKNVDPKTALRLNNNLGLCYLNIGNTAEAIHYLEAAVESAEEIGNINAQAVILNNIGIVHGNMGDKDRARPFYEKSYLLKKELGDARGSLFALANIARDYIETDSLKLAQQAIQEGLNIANKENDPYFRAYYLLIQGQYFEALEKFPLVITSAENSLAIATKNNLGPTVEADLNALFASGYLGTGEYGKSIEYAQLGLEQIEFSQKADSKLSLLRILSEAYLKQGEVQKGYEIKDEFYKLNDSMRHQKSQNQIALLEARMNAMERERTIDELKTETSEQALDISRQRKYIIGMGVGLGLIALLSFLLMQLLGKVRKNRNRITKEKQKVDELLFNMFPKAVVTELKENGQVKPRRYDSCTILFSDFNGFTNIASRLKPEILVTELDKCFKAFDDIIDKYDIEKIKTIGDSYMCVSGLPIPNSEHALNIVKAAQEMQQYLADQPMDKAVFREMKIGIHTGSVVAGIVGKKKYVYDIWGEGVNIAARLEDSCAAGKINISSTTYASIKHDFDCESRGAFDLKGVPSKVEMYYLK